MDLSRFGFTRTESRVYLALARLSPATGYAVAQAAGVARANTYDALEGLAARGAVTRLPGRPTRYAAAAPDALMGRLRREYSEDLESLAQELKRIEGPATPLPEQSLETLSSRASLLTAAAACAAGAREELLAVVGPWASAIYGDLESGGGRQAARRLLSLGAPAPQGAAVREVAAQELESYWGGLPIAIVADRRRAVCGVLRGAKEASGIATGHPGLVPFLRHLLRRELATAAPQRVS